MIAMPVRRDEVIDLFQSRVPDRRSDAFPVPLGALAQIAGIDEHRLARRRNDERRLAAFDVDGVNLQGFRGFP
jgi:hypothetical protein